LEKNYNMRHEHHHITPVDAPRSKKLMFGIIVLCAGVLFLFDNIGILPENIKHIFFSWQMLLIAIGLIAVSGHGAVPGLILISIGVFFLLPYIFNVPFNFTRLFWPVILIFIGIVIIFRRKPDAKRFCDSFREEVTASDLVDDVNVFSGIKRNINSQNFCGGRVTSIFGGAELDLTNAALAPGKSVMELQCIFGGVTLIVPAEWRVRIEVSSILGGFADKRQVAKISINSDSELIIRGVAIFGGGEIKTR